VFAGRERGRGKKEEREEVAVGERKWFLLDKKIRFVGPMGG